MTAETLPTGIDVLDRKLDGGIPPGRIVALTASPASQSELFLYELASVRRTVYLTTVRSESAVRNVLTATGTDPETVEVHRLDEDSLAAAERAIRDLDERTTVIVDPVELLERQDSSQYEAFLNELKRRLVASESIAVLHCLDRRTVPAARDTTEYVADVVFELSMAVRGETVENHLLVPKFRGGRALDERIKLNLTAEVTIDVSRTIA